MVSRRLAGRGDGFRGRYRPLYLLLDGRGPARSAAAVELGLDFPYQPSEQANVVTNVRPDSPAQRAGLRAGDKVVAFDGRRVQDAGDQARVWNSHEPGDSVGLTVIRPGQTAPLELTGIFRRNSDFVAPGTLRGAAGRFFQNSFPLAFATSDS
jgi:S1-C subfamily serine protease